MVSAGLMSNIDNYLKGIFKNNDQENKLQGELFSAPQDNLLVSYWKFDGDASDSIGGNNGNIYEAVLSGGILGNSYSFDGTNDYIQTSLLNSFDDWQKGTVSAWVKCGQDCPVGAIVAYTSKDVSTSNFFYRVNKGLEVAWNPSGTTSWNIITSSVPINDNKWHYLAFVSDGMSRTKIYLDGIEQPTTFTNSTKGSDSDFIADINGINSYNHHISMGVLNRRAPGNWFKGLIDEVKIYNYALTTDEIKKEYDSILNTSIPISNGTGGGGNGSNCVGNCGGFPPQPLNCVKCPDFNLDGVVNNTDNLLLMNCIDNNIGCRIAYDLNNDSLYSIVGDTPCIAKYLGNATKDISMCPNIVPPVKPVSCNDSDGGLNYSVKGVTAGNVDYCPTNDAINTLVEYTCNNKTNNVISNIYICPNGCVDGACVRDAIEVSRCDVLSYETLHALQEYKSLGKSIKYKESDNLKYNDYFVVLADKKSTILSISNIDNGPDSFYNDVLKLTDKINGDVYSVNWEEEGKGSIWILDKKYNVMMSGNPGIAKENYIIKIYDNDPKIDIFNCSESSSMCGDGKCSYGQSIYVTSDEPKRQFILNNIEYTLELISASDTSANVQISTASSKQTKEIAESSTKLVNGVLVKLLNSDESNVKLYADFYVGENIKNCNADCFKQDAICSNLIKEIALPQSFVSENIEYQKYYDSFYRGTWWIKDKEYPYSEYHGSWGGSYENKYIQFSYNLLVFDDLGVDVESLIMERTNYRVCKAESYFSGEKENKVYICNWDVLNNRQSLDNYQYKSREIIWANNNTAVEMYIGEGSRFTDEEILKLGQNRMNEFLNDLQDNQQKYVDWEYFNIDWPLSSRLVDALAKCPSELSTSTCDPCWSCKTEPLVCPEHGSQKKICTDSCCKKEKIEETFYCSPGICSGCMVPRWTGYSDSDNVCIPYGTRLSQTNTNPNEKEKIKQGEDLNENGELEYSLKINDANSAHFIFTEASFHGSAEDIIFDGDLYVGSVYELDLSNSEGSIIKFKVEKIVPGQGEEGYVEISILESFDAYCNYDGMILQQKGLLSDGSWASCQNNYECESNLCSGGECTDINQMIKETGKYKVLGVKILCKLADVLFVQDYDKCIVEYLGASG
jgi:hypothetical protein